MLNWHCSQLILWSSWVWCMCIHWLWNILFKI